MSIFSERKYFVSGIFVSVGIIFLIRLFYIQILDDEFKLSASNNVLRYETQYPARGLVYDRNGKLLVYNQAVYDLMVVPKQVKSIDTAGFCAIIGITRGDFIKKLRKAKAYSPVKPSLFEKQLSAETYAAFEEKMYKFPGFFVEKRTLRKYPRPIAAHLLGYIGEVDDKLTASNPYYRSGDYVGISGIEQSYEKELRGKRGVKILMVDVFNRPKGSFRNGDYDTLAVAGVNLTSTLDAELQEYGEKLMQNKMGGIAAIDPSTGEILALVTSPSYDPNLLVGRVRTDNYKQLLGDTLKPLFNRALMAYYPPGSTFKLINGLIGQQEKLVYPETRYPCVRGYPPGGGKPACHPHPAPLDFKESIQYSCNSYYTYVFRSIIDNNKYHSTEEAFQAWRDYVLAFGIGVRLHSDLPYELPGNVPTIKYYNKYFGKGHWKSSTILSLGIGQGELGVTPLQMANVIAVIANRGFFYVPHIIRNIDDSAENRIHSGKFSEKHYVPVDEKYYDRTIEGMYAVVESGTAANSKIKGIPFCGKTGTAQNPHGKDHSVFLAFAPKDNPRIAIAVLVENAGFGASWAAPIASLMIEKYLTDSVSRPELDARMKEANLLPGAHPKSAEEKP